MPGRWAFFSSLLVYRLGTADNEARGQDPELLQHAHGEGHQALVEDVGRGGEDGGDDEVDENRLLAIPGQKLRCDETQASRHDHGEGQFEDQPEGQK